MLRVCESACLGFAGSDSFRSRVVAGCENHAVSTVSESQRGAVRFPRASGCDKTSEVAVLESVVARMMLPSRCLRCSVVACGLLVLLVVPAVLRMLYWRPLVARMMLSSRCPSRVVFPTLLMMRCWKPGGRVNDAVLTVSESSRSVKAGENGESGLLEVIESDFSSPLSDSKSLLSSCHRMLDARALLCLLLLLVHLLLPHTVVALHLLLLLFRCACMLVTHVNVLIRGRTRVGFRVPRAGGVPKVGFLDRPKICFLSLK